MLYDILSPLLFFASLGGILLIIGRVVIRIRKELVSTALKSAAVAGPSASVVGWQPSAQEVSQILKPNQKSVHAIRSRFAFIGHSIRQTRSSIGTWQEKWAARRAAKKAAKAEAAQQVLTQQQATVEVQTLVESKNATDVASKTVITPTRRFARWRRRKVTQEEVIVTQQEEMSKAESAVSLVTTPVSPEEVSAAVHATQPSSDRVIDQPAPDRTFASSLLKRVQKKPRPNTLASAEAELQQEHYQVAEDMLVPYIVKHPKDTSAYVLLGQAAMGRGAWEEAMEIFEQIVKWNRKQPGGYAGLGIAAYRAGRFTKALQALQRAQDTDPANREVLEALLSIAEKMDNKALQHSIHEKLDVLRPQATPQENIHESVSAS